MKRIIFGMASLALIMVGCGGYGGGYGTPQATPPPATTPAVAAAGEIAVTATYPRFQPAKIEVTKDKAVRLKLTSADAAHTFTVDELGINFSIPSHQTVTQEITVNKTGAYTFYCAVPGHRAAGMQGTLEVK